MGMAKDRPYTIAMVLAAVLVLSACNLESPGSAETAEPDYPEAPLRARDSSPFNAVDHSPVAGAVEQSLTREVMVTFDAPLLIQTVTDDNVRLWQGRHRVPASVVYVADTRTIRLIPEQSLAPNSRYRVELSDSLMSRRGDTYAGAEWSFSTAGQIGRTRQHTLDACVSGDALALLVAVNEARSQARYCGQKRMPPAEALSYQCTLASVADEHAADLAGQSLLSHLSRDGLRLTDRVTNRDYAWEALGENLAVSDSDATGPVVAQWLRSEQDCQTLMNPDVTELGLGREQARDDTWYWVLNLATPDPTEPND